jgi:uncharacterized protein YcaQ
MRERGEVRSADFARRDGQAGGWWEWKPEKRALEALFTAGQVMVARRHNFQRVYDVRERVHPGWNAAPLWRRRGQLALNAVRVSRQRAGWPTTAWIAHAAAHSPPGAAGELHEAAVEGWPEPAYAAPGQRRSGGRVRRRACAPPAPRSRRSIPWFGPARTRAVFGFDYALELPARAPAALGYYVLPLLRRGQLIGRMDAKAHRQERRFEVKALLLEEDVKSSGALVRDVARALRELAEWHGTPAVDLGRTSPATLRRELAKQLA